MNKAFSSILGGVDKFSNELLSPTTGLGRLGMYLGAASGGALGNASLAAQNDQLARGDADLDRQYKQAQIHKIKNPAINNDTYNDYNLYLQKFGQAYADNWLKNNGDKPVAVQSADPVTGEVKTYFVRPGMIGGPPSMQAAPTAPVGKLTPIDGGPSVRPMGGF